MTKPWLTGLGTLLLLGLALLWALSFQRNFFALDGKSQIPSCILGLGCDFDGNYVAVKDWLAGKNPYEGFTRIYGVRNTYMYPPVVLAVFSWVRFFTYDESHLIWWVLAVGIFSFATLLAVRTRRKLGLSDLPLPLALAFVLGSYPVLFELERGNCNCLVLFGIGLVVLLWKGNQKGRVLHKLSIGIILGVAAWIKLYPALLLLALFFLRAWLALGAMVVTAAAIALWDWPGVLAFKRNLPVHFSVTPDTGGAFLPTNHGIAGNWRLISSRIPFLSLEKWVSPEMGWALIDCWPSSIVGELPNRSRPRKRSPCLSLFALGDFRRHVSSRALHRLQFIFPWACRSVLLEKGRPLAFKRPTSTVFPLVATLRHTLNRWASPVPENRKPLCGWLERG
jgi:hypothetical protein